MLHIVRSMMVLTTETTNQEATQACWFVDKPLSTQYGGSA
jgi:hypothetical protein